MCSETNYKRKRDRWPKNRSSETNFVNETTSSSTTTSVDVVFSVNNVELIDPASPPSSAHHRRRGRHRKIPKIDNSIMKTLPVPALPIANGCVVAVLISVESVVSRVVMDAVVKVFCVKRSRIFLCRGRGKGSIARVEVGLLLKVGGF
ncbi:unnamed protein product [Fraxinus pennsylvanica]|uniref:Uncharacterized protein n=1 Tax=Fraxinus pennsylvanica TaxID=56036 RepID=A0AAD1YQX3_9LAMI|nr:unnamed protein product [Fraxinus pennsylvanica]